MNQQVVFTQRAFNAILTETLDRSPLETGGIFIGYVLDNGIWIVVETIPPGIKTVNSQSYFEYDTNFVNYLSNVVAKQYKGNLEVLGLWHRHPGSMDSFSRTDEGTNLKFARANTCGAISALVNCDPRCRISMYHVNRAGNYERIPWTVDDGLIPEELLALRFNQEEDLPVITLDGLVIPAGNGSPEKPTAVDGAPGVVEPLAESRESDENQHAV